MEIAEIAIFIMGADILLLKCLAVISRLAMKYSRFKILDLSQRYIKFFGTDYTDLRRGKID
jgi:hypothetical protein